LCGAAPALGPIGLAPALFVAGLTGSTLHCAPMCGPFVVAQAADRLAAVPAFRLCELTRLRSGLLLPYHLGRLATYCGLGTVAAALGSRAAAMPRLHDVSGALLLLAALMFASQAIRRSIPARGAAAPPAWTGWIRRGASRIDRTRWPGMLCLGLLLGFLPCGLLYSALLTAAAGATPLQGATAMMGFGLGTMPALIATGIVGHVAARRLGSAVSVVGPVVLVVNAMVLAAIGWQQWVA
jgi:sulfite exporter TauE/SafE